MLRADKKLLARLMVEAQEKERNEIGRELHDNISQVLAASKLYVQAAMNNTGQDNKLLEKAHEYIVRVINEIRQISHQLVTPQVTELALNEAITELVADVQMSTPLLISWQPQEYREDNPDPQFNLMCYRVIQEQVNNIIKHANAMHVTIQLRRNCQELSLVISDDGRGFDTGAPTDGIGLRNIRQRVAVYDGELCILSSPGHGCILEVLVPLQQDKK